MKRTDIILNRDGSIYHLGILPEHINDIVITVGDPGRVEAVSRYFDKVSYQKAKREFITHVGEFEGVPMTVLSTGIGVDNTEIALLEVDTLVNIDLEALEEKEIKRSLILCRIGTSGALQQDVPIDSFLASATGIGIDNLLHYYNFEMNAQESDLSTALSNATTLPNKPYVKSADPDLLNHFSSIEKGLTLTTPGFYAPQGRQLRLGIRNPDFIADLVRFRHNEQAITNFEMETSAIYALSSMLGHKAISLNAILANRTTDQFSSNPSGTIDKLIQLSLRQLASFWRKQSQMLS